MCPLEEENVQGASLFLKGDHLLYWPVMKWCYDNILREKSLAIYFEDSQFRRNRTFNFKVSKIYVDKRSRVRGH